MRSSARAEPQIDTPDVVIMVEHFSGYAFGDATRPSQAAFLQRQATDAASRISGQIGDVFLGERESQVLNGTSVADLAAAFETYGEQWVEQVINPRLAAANSSCAAGALAISTVLGYERQRGLIGAGSNFSAADIYDLVKQAYPVCEEEAITKCKGLKDPSILLQFWITVNRQVQLLGAANIAPIDVDEAIKICTPTYTATGGGEGLTVTGTVADLTKTFTLEGTFPGASVTFGVLPGWRVGRLVHVQGLGWRCADLRAGHVHDRRDRRHRRRVDPHRSQQRVCDAGWMPREHGRDHADALLRCRHVETGATRRRFEGRIGRRRQPSHELNIRRLI